MESHLHSSSKLVNDLLDEQHENAKKLYIDGEEQAMRCGQMQIFSLLPHNDFFFDDAQDKHFRLAESQFLRLLSPDHRGMYIVTQVCIIYCLIAGKNKFKQNLSSLRSTTLSILI